MSGQKFPGLKGKLRSRACPLEVYVTLREGFSQGRQMWEAAEQGGSREVVALGNQGLRTEGSAASKSGKEAGS